jgi:spore coat protein U-like protein
MPQRRSIASALAALLLLAPAAARAAVSNCVVSVPTVFFGTFSGSQITVTSTISVTCNGNGSNQISIFASTGSSGNYSNRTMKNGSQILNYQLYNDSAHTIVFGNNSSHTNAGTISVNFPSNSPPAPPVTATFVIYAVLPAQAVPSSLPFVDTINLTFTNNLPPASFQVEANVVPSCTLTANNLNFGNYSGVQLDATTTLTATCASGAAYAIGLSEGVSAGATVSNRAMTGPGAALLHYGLFQDSARTLNWGDTVTRDTVASTGTGVAQTFTVYGRIPASQTVVPGAYQDTITATLTF